MRNALFIESSSCAFTPKEAWSTTNTVEHYRAARAFSLLHLGPGNNCPCLVIGSPIYEAGRLAEEGWDITYLDVRKPPEGFRFIQCDATDMRGVIADRAYDAISTSCVLCHAGMGRYGDPKVEDGDEKMMAEMFRVLVQDGKAAVMIGPVIDGDQPIVLGNCHRIYTVAEARRMAEAAGFEIKECDVWSAERDRWLLRHERPERFSASARRFDYLSMLLRRSDA